MIRPLNHFILFLVLAAGSISHPIKAQPQLMLQTQHEQGVDYGFFSHDGKLIYTVSRSEGLCKIWEAYSGKLLKNVQVRAQEREFYLMPTGANEGMFLLSDLTQLSFLDTKGEAMSHTDWVGADAPSSYHDEGSGALVFKNYDKKYYDVWDIRTGRKLIHRDYGANTVTYEDGAVVEVIDGQSLSYYDLSAHMLSDTIRLTGPGLGLFSTPRINALHHHVFYTAGQKIYCRDIKAKEDDVLYTGDEVILQFIISKDERFLLVQTPSAVKRFAMADDGGKLHIKEQLANALIDKLSDDYNDLSGQIIHFHNISNNVVYDIKNNKQYDFKTTFDDIGHWGRSKDFDLNVSENILAYTCFIIQPSGGYSTANNSVKVINLVTGDTIIRISPGANYTASSVSISPGGETILITGTYTATTKGVVLLYDLSGRQLWSAPSGVKDDLIYNDINQLDVINDSSMFTVMTNSGSKLWDLRKGNVSKFDNNYTEPSLTNDKPGIYDHRKQVIIEQEDKDDRVSVKVKNVATGRVVQSFLLAGNNLYMYRAMMQPGLVSLPFFSSDDKWLAFLGTSQLVLYKKNNTGLYSFTYIDTSLFTGINAVAFTRDSRKMYYATSDKKIKVYDLATATLSYLDISLPAQVKNIYFIPDGKSIILLCTGNVMLYYSLQAKKVLATFIESDASSVETVLPEGYYSMSGRSSSKIGFVNWPHFYPFDQLDVRYNRPDKVLQALGNSDKTLINSYYRAWQKRIKKLGIDTTSFEKGSSVPEGDFKNRDDIKYEQANGTIQLKVWGMDSTYLLDRYNVWVNDVPIYGMRGINIRGDSLHEIQKNISVVLSKGENKIETSVTNVNGIESYRIPLYVSYTPKDSTPRKLYFVGIGINRFRDPSHPLQWCVKDIHDLADSLSRRYGNAIVIDTLFDEQVSDTNVRKIKEHLAKSKVDDKVIIAYSGHGLISKSYDYYLSAYDVNFSKPEEGGIPYDDLEWLLDSIPVRNKLMLIDACHSGELDKDDLAFMDSVEKANGMKGLQLVAYPKTRIIGMKNSFELMQDLFANVGRGTGATVLSAAAGTQLAGEDSKYGNGFFTYSILELMRQKKNINVSELSSYVSKRVEEISNGLQKPTSRRENTDNDWEVW